VLPTLYGMMETWVERRERAAAASA
jgi:hypothetical protein